jgi:outer membrane protein assembly factor BamE (lipoprotein component of BamABCDE complex)
MNMKRILLLQLAIAFVFIFCLSAYGQSNRKSRNVLSFNSFGAVKVGMTVSQASKALGIPLVTPEEVNKDCYYVSPKQRFKEIDFMVTNNRIARIDTNSNKYMTSEGAKVGDTEMKIKRLYKGRIKVSPHKYVDGHYLSVEQGKFEIIFETDGKRVTSIRAGKSPEVGYVEGCS